MLLLLVFCPRHKIWWRGVVLRQTIVEQGVKHGTCVVSGQRLGTPGENLFVAKLLGQQRLCGLLGLPGLRSSIGVGKRIGKRMLLRILRLGLVGVD